MDDRVVLKFEYKGRDVDVVVEDIDKVMLIDIVIEYWEKAESENVDYPKYPEFTYLHKMSHVQLNNDKDLMNMFKNLSSKKVIYIWVGSIATPTTLVKSAMALRSTQKKGKGVASVHEKLTVAAAPVLQPRKKLTPRKKGVASVHEKSTNNSPPVIEIGQFNDEAISHSIEETYADVVASLHEPTNETMVLRRSPRGKTQGNTNNPSSQPVLHTPSVVGEKSKSVPSFLSSKIPKTTAIRKGLHEGGVGSQQPSQVTGKRKKVHTVSLSDDLEMLHDLNLSSDESYNPSSDDGEDTDESVCEEEEQGCDADYDFMVCDNFDPYEGPVWDDFDDEEDNYLAKLYKNGELYMDADFGSIVLKPWQLFTDKQHLRDVVRDYCIQCGFSVIVPRANNSMYTVICSSANCNWRLHAAKLPDGITWAIKSIQNQEHTCVGLKSRNPMVNVKWAAKVLIEDVRANNDIPAKALNQLLFQRFGVQMSQSTLYKVRQKALMEIHGGHDISYSHLPSYCEVIKNLNPGSFANCSWNPPSHIDRPLAFTSIFISFRGALDGLFAGCRSLIGVDGAHLKGNYGGVLLSAVALDGNNEIFPFAWAVVSGEDEVSWKFFIWHLKNVLQEGGRGDDWCVISDRQKGIDNALIALWPKVGRRYCCKHLSNNWKSQFPGPLMWSLFWKACGAYSAFTFRKAMEALQKTNPLALVWLSKLGPQSTWSKHQFNPNVKSDVNKTNFVESFNATLGIDRCRPILTLLEGIRRVTMVRMATRRQVCEEWDRADLCPNIIKRIQVISHDSRSCIPYLSGEGEYEVVDGKSSLPVSLNNKTCLCGAWQLSGLTCKHAMRAIYHARLDPHAFASPWYTVYVYKKAYSSNIKSIPDRQQWPEHDAPTIQPPALKRGIGRPPRNRRREEDEQRKCKRSKTVKCSTCKEFGHNAATCKGGLTAKEKSKKKPSNKGNGHSTVPAVQPGQNSKKKGKWCH